MAENYSGVGGSYVITDKGDLQLVECTDVEVPAPAPAPAPAPSKNSGVTDAPAAA